MSSSLRQYYGCENFQKKKRKKNPQADDDTCWKLNLMIKSTRRPHNMTVKLYQIIKKQKQFRFIEGEVPHNNISI